MENSNIEMRQRRTGHLDYQTLKLDIATRLFKACADWPREDFDAIVEKIAQTTLKYPEPSLHHAG